MTGDSSLPVACAACDDDLSAWVDGELDERRAREVSAHVAACDRCRPRVDALHAVDGALRALSDAPLTRSEAARLERARVAAVGHEGHEPRNRELPRDCPPLVATAGASPRTAGPARRRRRRLLTTGLAAVAGVAAVALGVLVAPGLVERTAGRMPGAGEGPVSRAEGVAREGALADRSAAEPAPRAPSAAVPRPKPQTPGHLGASAPADPIAESGAAAPSDFDPADRPLLERLDALDALPRLHELSSEDRRRLVARLDPLGAAEPEDRARLRANFERWRTTPTPERDALRERWRRFQALTDAERDRLFRTGSAAP